MQLDLAIVGTLTLGSLIKCSALGWKVYFKNLPRYFKAAEDSTVHTLKSFYKLWHKVAPKQFPVLVIGTLGSIYLGWKTRDYRWFGICATTLYPVVITRAWLVHVNNKLFALKSHAEKGGQVDSNEVKTLLSKWKRGHISKLCSISIGITIFVCLFPFKELLKIQ